jgi:hypothetical protein
MTEVQALLSVDSGHIPPGAAAFFLEDPGRGTFRLRATLAAMAGLTSVGCAWAGAGQVLVSLLVLGAAALAVLATPTIEEEDEEEADRPAKRQVMVVTPQGIIVRDDWGLRSWQFDDLTSVVQGAYNQRPHLVLIDRHGARHAIDYLRFQRAERVREVIDTRVRLRQSPGACWTASPPPASAP